MARHERLLVAPESEELASALREAVQAANGKSRERLLQWPLEGSRGLLAETGLPAVGYRQWNGGERRGITEARSVVALAWWTDHLGRKHFRIIARRGKFTRGELDNLLVPGVDDRPPLALVYPDYVLLKRAAGQRSLIAICGCGVFGAPEQLAWMGSCCGPCHDQREERGHPAKPWPDPGKTTVFGTVPATALSFRPILACSPDGRTLAVNKAAEAVTLWDLQAGKERSLQLKVNSAHLRCGDITPDGRYLLTGALDGRIHRWDFMGEHHELLFEMPAYVNPIAVSPNGSLLAWHDFVGGLSVRELATAGVRYEHLGTIPDIRCIAFSPDSNILAGGNHEGQVRFWDLRTATEQMGPNERTGEVHSLSFTPDGRFLAVGRGREVTMLGPGEAPPVLIWDMAQRCLRSSLAGGLPAAVSSVAFAPDGRTLVAGHEDGTVRLWDSTTGDEIMAIEWHQSEVCCVKFFPDGKLLATMSDNGTVKVWPWEVLRPCYAEGT